MLHSYSFEKASDALAAFESEVTSFDAQRSTASKRMLVEDELKTLRRRLDAAALVLGREQAETQALDTTFDRYLRAATRIEDDIAAGYGVAAADKENSLALLVAALEALAPRLKAEASAARDSEAWMKRLSRAASRLETKLQDVDAEDMAASVAQPSGLVRSLSQINAMLDIMVRDAGQHRGQQPDPEQADDLGSLPELAADPNIAQALGRARAATRGDSADLQHRLAELLRGKSAVAGGRGRHER